ncbi:MAG: flagellar basal body-associated FliL family protein [Tissierellales bacterium]
MSTKKIFLLATIAFVLIMVIVGSVFFLISYNKNTEKEKTVELFYYDVGEIYCNLKDSNKIVKLKVTLELTNESIIEELEKRNFSIKHEINAIMMNKTKKDLEGNEGLLELQSEITNKLIEIFNTKNIIRVYFEEFIVQ